MGMHERRSGEDQYDIEVLPLVPPMSNGNSHEAKVVRFVQRQPSSRAESASPLSFRLRRGKTEAEAVQMVEADVEAWIPRTSIFKLTLYELPLVPCLCLGKGVCFICARFPEHCRTPPGNPPRP